MWKKEEVFQSLYPERSHPGVRCIRILLHTQDGEAFVFGAAAVTRSYYYLPPTPSPPPPASRLHELRGPPFFPPSHPSSSISAPLSPSRPSPSLPSPSFRLLFLLPSPSLPPSLPLLSSLPPVPSHPSLTTAAPRPYTGISRLISLIACLFSSPRGGGTDGLPAVRMGQERIGAQLVIRPNMALVAEGGGGRGEGPPLR